MRTTLEIDAQILRELKRILKKEGTSLGRLVSNLLAQALNADAASATPSPPVWIAKQMGARVNLSDMVRLYHAVVGFPVAADVLVYSRDDVDYWRDSLNHVLARALREGKVLYERRSNGSQ